MFVNLFHKTIINMNLTVMQYSSKKYNYKIKNFLECVLSTLPINLCIFKPSTYLKIKFNVWKMYLNLLVERNIFKYIYFPNSTKIITTRFSVNEIILN